jgi:hypothetical protein
MAWVWKNGVPTVAPIIKAPGDMKLTSGSAAIATKVPCIEISDAFHTLEVHLSPPGSKQKQMSIVRKHSDIYHINVSP